MNHEEFPTKEHEAGQGFVSTGLLLVIFLVVLVVAASVIVAVWPSPTGIVITCGVVAAAFLILAHAARDISRHR